jgi:hypothetical protein
MRDSGYTPAPVILESRQQLVAARLANECSDTLRKQHQDPTLGTPLCKAAKEENEHGRTIEGMNEQAPHKVSVVRTVIMDDSTAAKRAE